MAAVARSRPQPLEQHIFVPTRRKYQYVRLKEMLSNALGGSRGSGLFATSHNIPGPIITGNADASSSGTFVSPSGYGLGDAGGSGEVSRRPSLMQQAVAAGQRKASASAAVAQ